MVKGLPQYLIGMSSLDVELHGLVNSNITLFYMKSALVGKIINTDAIDVSTLLETPGKIYTFLNPVSYLSALDNKDLFAKFDGIFADGSILVSAIKLLYGHKVTRHSFDMTSLAPTLLKYAEENKKSVYIVASRQEQVKKAVEIFKKLFYSKANMA